MNRKTLTLLGMLAAGLVLLSIVFLAGNASAKDRKTSLVSQAALATEIPGAGPTSTVATEVGVDSAIPMITWALNDAEQMKKNAEVVTQVEALLEKSEILSATTTWVHSSVKTDLFIALSDATPDGSPMPENYTTDYWFLLDESGYHVQGVVMQDTGIPASSQLVTFKDGIWTNLTYKFTDRTEPSRPADHTILEQALLSKDSVRLDFGYTEINGQRVAVYTMIHEASSDPYEIGIPGYLTKGYAYKYYLSLETGSVVMMEYFYITAEGKLDLVQRDTTLVEEKLKEPPAEILKYLE